MTNFNFQVAVKGLAKPREITVQADNLKQATLLAELQSVIIYDRRPHDISPCQINKLGHYAVELFERE